MTYPTNNDIRELMKDAGECIGEAAKALGVFFREFVAFACAVAPVLKWHDDQQHALAEAPPRVRHLVNYGKKYRTQKKNTNRALKDYRKRR